MMKESLGILIERIESWLSVIEGPEYASVREDMRKEVRHARALLAKIEGKEGSGS